MPCDRHSGSECECFLPGEFSGSLQRGPYHLMRLSGPSLRA